MTSTPEDIPYKLNDYTVLELLGEGSFGMVAKCLKVQTSEVVAVKILKDNQDSNLEQEVAIIQSLSVINPDKSNIVRLIDFFNYGSYQCMAFEMLDCSLHDLMKQRQSPFELGEIRPIAQQLLVAFEALKSIGILHTDLKPDNIMLVNHKDQHLKVKLIDFGLATHRSELSLGMFMQPCGFRAPEVTLGLPLSEAMDMWSLGCCLGKWYIGCDMFSGSSPYDNIRTIVHLLGQPNDELLNKGRFTKEFFAQTNGTPQWRLLTPHEYTATNGVPPDISESPLDVVSDLDDAIKNNGSPNQFPEYRDRMAFLSLLKNLLRLDSKKRMTPSEALQHPFITMEYLVENRTDYAQWARDIMTFTLRDVTPGCAPHDESRDEDLEPENSKNEASSNIRDQIAPQPTGSTPVSEKESNIADVPCLTETDNQIATDSTEDTCIDPPRNQQEGSTIPHKNVSCVIETDTQTRVRICINQRKDKQEGATVLHENVSCVIEIDTQTEVKICINQRKGEQEGATVLHENVSSPIESDNRTAVGICVNQPRDKQEVSTIQQDVHCLTGMIGADSNEDVIQEREEEERSTQQSPQPTADTCVASNTAGSSEHNKQTPVTLSPTYKRYITNAATVMQALLFAPFLGSFILVAAVVFALGLVDILITKPHSSNHDPHSASRTTPATTRRSSGSSSIGR